MYKTLVLIVSLFLSTTAFAQYISTEKQEDVTLTKEYLQAEKNLKIGAAVLSVGGAVCLAGNVICIIERNTYANAHSKNGSPQEILELNAEAKKQPGYKTGEIMEIVGFASAIAGVVMVLQARGKKKKLTLSSGADGLGLAYCF